MFKKIKLITKIMQLIDQIEELINSKKETFAKFTDWINQGKELFPELKKTVDEIIAILKK